MDIPDFDRYFPGLLHKARTVRDRFQGVQTLKCAFRSYLFAHLSPEVDNVQIQTRPVTTASDDRFVQHQVQNGIVYTANMRPLFDFRLFTVLGEIRCVRDRQPALQKRNVTPEATEYKLDCRHLAIHVLRYCVLSDFRVQIQVLRYLYDTTVKSVEHVLPYRHGPSPTKI